MGLWERFDPEDLATASAFQKRPALVWGWYEWRRARVIGSKPNEGHLAIARWTQFMPVSVITQNVDDLHERAGSGEVIHLHGSLFSPRCFDCQTPYAIAQSAGDIASNQPMPPPHCPHCDGLIRPGVVWFNEALPRREWSDAVALCHAADLMIVVGTSALVYPAASLPEVATRSGGTLVTVNPNATPLDSRADFVIRGTAGDVLPRLLRAAVEK